MNAKYAGLVPLPILFAGLAIVILSFYPEQNLPTTPVFDLPYPFSSAHSLFLSTSALIVAYFFGRGFLSTRSFNLVTLGSGSLILGLGFLLSQILGSAPFGGPNQLTGISSIVFLFSGIFFGAFATLSLIGKTIPFGRPKLTLLGSYLGSVALVVVIILSVENRLTPDFFVKGVGPTLLRGQVLGGAIVLFSYSSIVSMRNYVSSRVSILYWFSLGLACIAVGFLSAFLGKVPGGPFSWLGRISVALGGIYLVISILAAFRGEGRMNR